MPQSADDASREEAINLILGNNGIKKSREEVDALEEELDELAARRRA